MTEIDVKSYAKINLSLDVGDMREDGFHQVETVMQRISLCDRVHIEWEESSSRGFDIQVATNRPYLPVDERNLAYRAAKLMADTYGAKACGGTGESEKRCCGGTIRINIKKNIPVSAGLAGGSGNCAAVLIGLNRLWNLRLNTKELCSIGADLGSDIPFCVLTQNTRYDCALATGRGEVLTPLSRGLKKFSVLAKPNFGIPTREVFQHIDDYDIRCRPDNLKLIRGLAAGKDELIYPNMINVLELYTLERYEPVRRLKDQLAKETGAEAVLMSGSGPTVFGIYSTKEAAKEACDVVRCLKYEAYWASTTGR